MSGRRVLRSAHNPGCVLADIDAVPLDGVAVVEDRPEAHMQ
jgi:hypothetical protein